LTHTTTPLTLHLSSSFLLLLSPSSFFRSRSRKLVEEESYLGGLGSLERIGELIEVTILIQLVMFLSHTNGLCLELEHSHFDIIMVVHNSYALVML
jgi:hypothetical protein